MIIRFQNAVVINGSCWSAEGCNVRNMQMNDAGFRIALVIAILHPEAEVDG